MHQQGPCATNSKSRTNAGSVDLEHPGVSHLFAHTSRAWARPQWTRPSLLTGISGMITAFAKPSCGSEKQSGTLGSSNPAD